MTNDQDLAVGLNREGPDCVFCAIAKTKAQVCRIKGHIYGPRLSIWM
jgi:hypothetical protein